MSSDELLGLNSAILDELRRLGAVGTSAHAMIQYLHDAGVTKPGAVLALRRTKVMASPETKEAVHYHPAYDYRREADEQFQDDAIAAMDEIQARERAGSAAA